MGWELRDAYISAFSGKLTRFEMARIIGARALQLSMGAPPLVELENREVVDPVYVAVLELMRGALPMSVLRRVGDKDELTPVQRLVTPSVKRYLSTIIESWDISSRV